MQMSWYEGNSGVLELGRGISRKIGNITDHLTAIGIASLQELVSATILIVSTDRLGTALALLLELSSDAMFDISFQKRQAANREVKGATLHAVERDLHALYAFCALLQDCA
jgi:hypothetical protein